MIIDLNDERFHKKEVIVKPTVQLMYISFDLTPSNPECVLTDCTVSTGTSNAFIVPVPDNTCTWTFNNCTFTTDNWESNFVIES